MGHPCARLLAPSLRRGARGGAAHPWSLLGCANMGLTLSSRELQTVPPPPAPEQSLAQPCQQLLPLHLLSIGEHSTPGLHQHQHEQHQQHHQRTQALLQQHSNSLHCSLDRPRLSHPHLFQQPKHPLTPPTPSPQDPLCPSLTAAAYSPLTWASFPPHSSSSSWYTSRYTSGAPLAASLPKGVASRALPQGAAWQPGGVPTRGLAGSTTGRPEDSAKAQTKPTSGAPRAASIPGLGMLAGPLQSVQAQASQLWRAARALRAVQAVGRGWEAFSRLPPVSKRIAEARGAVARRQEAAGIQLQAFWRQHSGLVTAAGGGLAVLALDQALLTLLYPFLAHPLALSTHLTTLGVSAGSVLATGAFLSTRTAISVDTVTAMALAHLNSHPGVLEVLGAPISPGIRTTGLPLWPPSRGNTSTSNSASSDTTSSSSSSDSGSDSGSSGSSGGSRSGSGSGGVPGVPVHGSSAATVAAAMVGGGVKIKFGLREGPLLLGLELPPRTCVAVFGARGAEATGVVSAVVTKHHGQYKMELLAVDVQIPPEGARKIVEQQRVFVLGTHQQCSPYDDLISSLAGTFQAAARLSS